jgi:hypothetical protein
MLGPHAGSQVVEAAVLAKSKPFCPTLIRISNPATGANSGYKVRCHTAERAKDWKKDLLYRSCKKDK